MADRIRPVVYTWDGENMVPLQRFKPMCNKQYVVGEEYVLTLLEHRSLASHNHFFAAVSEAWKNLPEKVAERFPSAEHLRKWALVQVGFAKHSSLVCDNRQHALDAAATVRNLDEFAVIKVEGNVVHVWVAASQAMHNMPQKQDFETSKSAVLDLLASMIKVPRSQLSQEAERISGRKESPRKTRFN